ncbi:MAG: hypothetical protein KDC11_10865, partial [Chitinophagaceae bacterium]|nr:hypothetical protein [Chitinophagaceae bacterium]
MFWLWVILALLAAATAGYFSWRADVKREIPYPWLPATLRALIVLTTAMLLLAPAFTIEKNEIQKPIVLFLQDDSRSVNDALDKESDVYEKDVDNLLDKFSSDYKVVKWNLSGQTDSLHNYNNEVTDLSAALNKVQEFYGTQNLGAVILATDGRYNQGINPLYQPLVLKGNLYTVGIGDTTMRRDLRVAQTFANKTVSLNNSFEIRADIVADKCRGYNNTIKLTEDGNVLSTATLNINSDRYDRTVSFTIKANTPGLHHYVITAPAMDGEENTVNNRRDVFVEVVDEQKHILIAGHAPHPDIKAIKEALKGLDNYKITTRVNNDFPNLLDDYDVLILHQLPGQGYRYNITIQQAKKPTLYILGQRSDNAAYTTMPKPAALNINTNAPRNVFATYNAAFNGFNLPQNIRSVVDKLPPLTIPMGSIQLNPEAQALFTDKQSGTPLWMLGQGAIPTAMISGEGLWRWRMYEYKNFGNTDVIDECIRQTISFLSTADNKNPFRVTLPKHVWSDQEAISFNAYLRNANNEPINGPDVTLTIKDSSGSAEQYNFERTGTTYRLNIGIRAGGTYTYTASVNYNGKTLMSTGSFVVESIPLELMQTGADY